jgi:sec-independent protein translocase protein TatB
MSFGETIFLFLLALVIFGPKRLPEIGRQVGKLLAEFRRYSNDFKYQLESEVRQWEVEETVRKEKQKEAPKELVTTPEGTVPNGANPEAVPESAHGSAIEGAAAESTQSIYPENSVSKETNA